MNSPSHVALLFQLFDEVAAAGSLELMRMTGNLNGVFTRTDLLRTALIYPRYPRHPRLLTCVPDLQ
jgi:hypothetical protein